MKNLFFLTTILFIFILFSCTSKQENKQTKLNIVCTTGMIADAAEQITGNLADVSALMRPGVDPHLYKATQGDLSLLQNATLICYNGLHLEGKMVEILEKLAAKKATCAVANGVPLDKLRQFGDNKDAKDPHIWFDVAIWSKAVEHLSQAIIKADPVNQEVYQKNTEMYLKELANLDSFVQKEIASIPKESRVLITAHDAFGYFGARYNIEVRGLQGISTQAEFGLNDVTDLVDFIVKRKIKSVFVETSVSERSIKAVVEGCKEKGHNIQIGGTLFSDAMGEKGTPEGNYLGMVKANVKTIVSALK